MLNRLASLAMSTSILKALPGTLDIKRHSPSILYLLVVVFLEIYNMGQVKRFSRISGILLRHFRRVAEIQIFIKTYLIVIKDETGLNFEINDSTLFLIGSYAQKLVASY